MSTAVTYVGTQYNVPAYQDTGYAQGTGNLSSYLIALATGSLTLSGGTFTLTADADFGANFGLKSIYYKSRAANISSVGVIRLGSTEIIGWRNNANDGDLELTTNASDQLTYNGAVIASSGGALFGTSLTLSATSNQMTIGTTNTTTLSFTAPAASRTYTIPDAGGAADFVLTAGTQTVGGAKTFSSAVTINPTSNQLVLGVTNTTTISATAPAASRVYTLPDAGGAADFVLTAGAQTVGGAKTFSSAVTINPTSSQLVLGVTNTTTISATAPAASRVVTIPDPGGAASFVMTEGTQTINGAKTFGSTIATSGVTNAAGVDIQGTNTNDDAAAGYVGEYTESSQATTNSPATDTWGDLTSISLTAGDWNVQSKVTWILNTATGFVSVQSGVGTSSGNVAPLNDNRMFALAPTASATVVSTAGPITRISVASTTTIYLKMLASFSGGQPQINGVIRARRVR